MKHTIYNVYEIKTLFTKYIIFKKNLYFNDAEFLIIYVNNDFEINFINEFLLFRNLNLLK